MKIGRNLRIWLVLSLTTLLLIPLFPSYSDSSSYLTLDISEPITSDLSSNLWVQCWTGDEFTFSDQYASNNSIYVCGHDNPGNFFSVVVKYFANGTQAWNKTLKKTGEDIMLWGIWGEDEVIFTTGGYRNSTKGYDLLLSRWDTNGTIAWNRTWDNYHDDYGYSIWGLPGGDIFVQGNSRFFDNCVTLTRWTRNGDLVWNTTLNYNDDCGLVGQMNGYSPYLFLTSQNHTDNFLSMIWENGTIGWEDTWPRYSLSSLSPLVIWCNGSSAIIPRDGPFNVSFFEYSMNGTKIGANLIIDELGFIDYLTISNSYIYAAGSSFIGDNTRCFVKHKRDGTFCWRKTDPIFSGAIQNRILIDVDENDDFLYTMTTFSNLTLMRWDPLGFHPDAAFQSHPAVGISSRGVRFTPIGNPGDTPTTYLWEFGDASPNATSSNPTHIYDAPGTYTVKVTIEDVEGEIASDQLSITIVIPFGDEDGDGMSNVWENDFGLNLNDSSDAAIDTDGDGLTNLNEYLLGTNPLLLDSDGDGVGDGDEVTAGTDPNNPWSNVGAIVLSILIPSSIGLVVIISLINLKRKKKRTKHT